MPHERHRLCSAPSQRAQISEKGVEVNGYRLLAGAVTLIIVVSGCGTTTTPTSTASPSTAPSPTPSAIPATSSPVAATPSPVPPLAIGDLPRVDLADVDATAVCDPEPSQANLDAGDSTVACADGLELALKAVRTMTEDPATVSTFTDPGCGHTMLRGRAGHGDRHRLDRRARLLGPHRLSARDRSSALGHKRGRVACGGQRGCAGCGTTVDKRRAR